MSGSTGRPLVRSGGGIRVGANTVLMFWDVILLNGSFSATLKAPKQIKFWRIYKGWQVVLPSLGYLKELAGGACCLPNVSYFSADAAHSQGLPQRALKEMRTDLFLQLVFKLIPCTCCVQCTVFDHLHHLGPGLDLVVRPLPISSKGGSRINCWMDLVLTYLVVPPKIWFKQFNHVLLLNI